MIYIPPTIEGWGGDIDAGSSFIGDGGDCIFPYGWQGSQREGWTD